MPDMPPLIPVNRKYKKKKKDSTHYGKTHRELRLQLLALHAICQICNEAWSTEADHLVYPARSLADYQAVCKPCHVKKHQKPTT